MSDVQKIHESYAAQLDRIQNSRVYSEHAKQVYAAKLYKQTQEQLEAARTGEVEELRKRRAGLQRRMFGHDGTADPQTVIARRDANDRAAKLDSPHAATEALQRAEMEGDDVMARAIVATAAQYGWNDVLTAYAAPRPGFTAAAQELNELPDPDNTEWRLRHTAQFMLPAPPALVGVHPWEIDRLAQQDVEAA